MSGLIERLLTIVILGGIFYVIYNKMMNKDSDTLETFKGMFKRRDSFGKRDK